MSSEYFTIEQGFPSTGRWYLGRVYTRDGDQVDTSVFFHGVPIDPGPPVRLPLVRKEERVAIDFPLSISLDRAGPPLDFTLGGFDLPVVTKRIADLLAGIAGAGIQRFPALIEGQQDTYEILNITSRADCLDATASSLDWWPNTTPAERKPIAIYKLVIDRSAVAGHNMFRLANVESILIVSKEVKDALENASNNLGVKFVKV